MKEFNDFIGTCPKGVGMKVKNHELLDSFNQYLIEHGIFRKIHIISFSKWMHKLGYDKRRSRRKGEDIMYYDYIGL